MKTNIKNKKSESQGDQDKSKTNGKKKIKNILIIVNPASGKDEPIINPINDTFHDTEINWDIKITKKFGDAEQFTKEAIKNGVDVVVGYGGDGTQHEIANGILKSNAPGTLMAILLGGTGNGFGTGLGIPAKLSEALKLINNDYKIKKVDAMKITNADGQVRYGISRMYTGIEEDQQTSRELKNKYGLLAYAVTTVDLIKNVKQVKYNLRIDEKVFEGKAVKCYVANSGSTGIKISLGDFDVTDGLLDVFSVGDIQSLIGAKERILKRNSKESKIGYWRGKNITINPEKSQAVWIDGEYNGCTPVKIEVMPGALNILVP